MNSIVVVLPASNYCAIRVNLTLFVVSVYLRSMLILNYFSAFLRARYVSASVRDGSWLRLRADKNRNGISRR